MEKRSTDYSGEREMVEHVFTVGKEEKQRMRISHSATTGKVSIIVNGKSIVAVNGRALRPLSRVVDSITISFNIGEGEKHKVNIRIRGIYWNHFEAYSDDEVVYRS
jgi:hypothetical protein